MMLAKFKITPVTIILFALFSMALMACGGGGGGSAPARPTLEVLPAGHDFGIVTDANSVAPLEVTIRNNGAASLSVSAIELTDTVNFGLNLGGANPCPSVAPTIGAGSSCTVTVDFNPQAVGVFSEDLTIRSDDPTTPVFDLSLLGSMEDITAISVTINQINACPRPVPDAEAFVAVTDQGGFPVTTLNSADFTLAEGATIKTVTSSFVNDTVELSVAILADFSGSITNEPLDVQAMKNAAISLVNRLGAGDEAEIIKYASDVEVTQAFTSDKALLTAAIQSDPNIGVATALFDAVDQAIIDISTRTKTRKAIIIITDGDDRNSTDTGPQSVSTLNSVIDAANASGVPVFTVGLDIVDTAVLQDLADGTGGTFSDSTTSANLATIYNQLADLLFTDQYILTYTSGVAENVSGDLTVTATFAPGITGTDTKFSGIPVCP